MTIPRLHCLDAAGIPYRLINSGSASTLIFPKFFGESWIFANQKFVLHRAETLRQSVRINFMLTKRVIVLCVLLLSIASVPAGELLRGNPENYRQLLKRMAPGSTLQLQAGEYQEGLPVHRLKSEPGKPVIITGPEIGPRPVFVARPKHNTISIFNSSHVTIRNLELDGRGLPVDAVKAEGHADWAHHITLENLLIRGHGNNQQTVGISTKCPTWNWVIRDNEIIAAGTGIYLGNSDGSDPFIAGLIEHNLVVDTLGYNLQVKHQRSRPDIAGIPEGENVTIIRHNVFSKADGGSEAPMARPNVLVGHWPLSGPGADDHYLIYGNFFYQNPHEALFQGEGNIALYNNLFVNQHGHAIHIQPHNDVPRVIDVFYNTILASGTGISILEKEGASQLARQSFAQNVTANAVFASMPIIGGKQMGNITASLEGAAGYLDRPLASLGEMSLYPKPGKLQSGLLDTGSLPVFIDSDRDFNAQPRVGRFLGAYNGQGLNPGWFLGLERKPGVAGD
jgi:hypothetical protein